MDEDKLLNELRAQRALLQKHLEWLDQKIAALDRKDEQATQAPDVASTKAPDDAVKKKVETENINDPSRPEAEDEDVDPEFGHYKAPRANEIHRAKIGCLVLFVLSTLLFLFLLFGLPYLMD